MTKTKKTIIKKHTNRKLVGGKGSSRGSSLNSPFGFKEGQIKPFYNFNTMEAMQYNSKGNPISNASTKLNKANNNVPLYGEHNTTSNENPYAGALAKEKGKAAQMARIAGILIDRYPVSNGYGTFEGVPQYPGKPGQIRRGPLLPERPPIKKGGSKKRSRSSKKRHTKHRK